MGQKHIVEIIFDTSHSMNAIVDYENNISRLDIAKYTFKKIMEDVILPSSFKYRIQCFLNCDTYIVRAEDIYSTKTYGNTPLFRAIGNSLEYLLQFEKSHKKSIIILSDGEDTCWQTHYISEKDIVMFIKKNSALKDVNIYILKIGEVSAQAEKEYNYLYKKTEGKKYLVDLKNYKKTVGNIKKDLYSILNRSKIKSFFYSILNFIKKIILLLIFILFIFECYSFLEPFIFLQFNTQKVEKILQKPKKSIHSNIITCDTKTINGLKIEECTFKPNKTKKAIIYNKRFIVLENFISGKSELDENSTIFLDDIFRHKITNKIIFITIYGHTDLERFKPNSKFDSSECKKEGIDSKNNPNRCLAFMRAFEVKNVISKIIDKKKIYINYYGDFFMKNTNDELDGKLWKILDIEKDVNNLMKELTIPKNYNQFEIRQKFKQRNLEEYKEKFAPFRSVVIKID